MDKPTVLLKLFPKMMSIRLQHVPRPQLFSFSIQNQTRLPRLPLPAGEGRGEGERNRFLQRLQQSAFASLLLFTPLAQAAFAEHQANADRDAKSHRAGARFLYENQNPAGWWSSSELPALTALALVALEMAEVAKLDAKYGSERRRALDFIAGSAKPDGSIHRGQLVNYNTACSLMALSLADEPRFRPLIIKARAYIAASQIDLGEKGKLDNFHDGESATTVSTTTRI